MGSYQITDARYVTDMAFETSLGLLSLSHGPTGASDDHLYQIDTETVAATLIGQLDTENPLGLAVLAGPVTLAPSLPIREGDE